MLDLDVGSQPGPNAALSQIRKTSSTEEAINLHELSSLFTKLASFDYLTADKGNK